jgi:hypothetical protein
MISLPILYDSLLERRYARMIETTFNDLKSNQLVAQTVVGLFNKIIEFDTTFIESLIIERKKWSHGRVKEIKSEYAKYLAICYFNRGERFAPSKDVDEFWHQHILCTADYLKFCDRTLGKFIHHKPNLKSQRSREESLQRYNQFIETYYLHFGPLNESIWPQAPINGDLATSTNLNQSKVSINSELSCPCGDEPDYTPDEPDDDDDYQEPVGCENEDDDGDPCGWPNKCEGPG